MTVYELSNRLKRFDLNAEIVKAIKMTKEAMIEKNREQLMKGRNTINLKILPRYKSKSYAKKKFARNAKPGRGVPDLNNTGAFQAAIDVKVTTKQFEFFSRDEKAPMLVEKYPLILGMTAKATEQYSKNTLLPVLENSLKTKLAK